MKKHHWHAFRHKSYLKSNRYHTTKHSLKGLGSKLSHSQALSKGTWIYAPATPKQLGSGDHFQPQVSLW